MCSWDWPASQKCQYFHLYHSYPILYSQNNNKSLKSAGLWFIPVVLVPLIWPTYALIQGDFDAWWEGVYWQTHRQDEGMTLQNVIVEQFLHKPIFYSLGLSGLAFAIIRKDYFLILWAFPFLIFLYVIGFVRDFHLVPLLPALCMAASRLIVGLSAYISHQKVRRILPFGVISAISIFGLANILPQLASNENDSKFALAAIVTKYLEDHTGDNITVISSHIYSWIPKYVFGLGNIDYKIPEDIRPPETNRLCWLWMMLSDLLPR